jgi:hypothetical protein
VVLVDHGLCVDPKQGIIMKRARTIRRIDVAYNASKAATVAASWAGSVVQQDRSRASSNSRTFQAREGELLQASERACYQNRL